MRPSAASFRGRLLVGTAAHGELVALAEPVSFWGGVDPVTGTIVDRSHPQYGLVLANRVVVMPGSRGSSSSSSTLLECVRRSTAPTVLVLGEPDLMLTVGALAARELYDRSPTVIVVPDIAALPRMGKAHVGSDGTLTITDGAGRP